MFDLFLFSGATPSLNVLRSFSVSAQREGYSKSHGSQMKPHTLQKRTDSYVFEHQFSLYFVIFWLVDCYCLCFGLVLIKVGYFVHMDAPNGTNVTHQPV